MSARLTKSSPRHAAVAETEAEITALEGQLADARTALAEIRTKREQLERAIREARIAYEMGQRPPVSVGDLKAELEIVEDAGESAEARCVGLQRAIEGAKERGEAARQALKRAQWTLIEKLAAERVDRMKQRALDFQADQRDLIALTHAAVDAGFHYSNVEMIVPLYLLYAEIVSSHGGGSSVWPQMGDRVTPRELLADQIAEIKDQLDAA